MAKFKRVATPTETIRAIEYVKQSEQEPVVITSKVANVHINHRFNPVLVAKWNELRAQFPSADACLEHVFDLVEQEGLSEQRGNEHVEGLDGILTLLDFSDSERELVRGALAHSALPWQALFKTGILTRMRVLNPDYKPRAIADVDLTNPKDRWHVRGASTARCRQVLDEVIAANNAATSPSGKRYITRNLLSQLVGCSPTIAIRFCEANAEEIADHNNSMGFTSPSQGKTHNQYVYKGL